jgi:hypothetical protein
MLHRVHGFIKYHGGIVHYSATVYSGDEASEKDSEITRLRTEVTIPTKAIEDCQELCMVDAMEHVLDYLNT